MSEVGSMTPITSTYEWKIPNFHSYAEYAPGKSLTSPCFSTHHSEKNSTNTISLQWKLRIYPNGKHETNSQYVSIYVENCNVFKVTAKYSITIMALGFPNDNIKMCDVTARTFKGKGTLGNEAENCWPMWGSGNFAKRQSVFSEESKFITNDTLTISCRIFGVSINPDDQEFTSDSTSEVHNHFENLLETGQFSDVTFIIGEKSMQLHKAILTSESAVFRAMFDHEMKEQKDNVVTIIDVDFNVMKELIRHIYAKKVNGIDEIVEDLLVAADKYCLTGLKELCDKTLCKNLNKNNALQYLELAIKYDAKKLKSQTVDYIVDNLQNIVQQKEFLDLDVDCKNNLLIHIANNQ